MQNKNVVVTCPPCGENVAIATKRGFLNKESALTTPHRPYGALPPQVGKLTARGFTLIELLVVVLIIGILAAVAVPQYQKAVIKSQYAKLKVLAAAITQAQEVYYLANGQYTTSFAELDIDMPGGKTNESTDNMYVYDWGFCTLGHIDNLLDQANCKNTDINMAYHQRYAYSILDPLKRFCVALNTTDTNSLTAKICRDETGVTGTANNNYNSVTSAYQ